MPLNQYYFNSTVCYFPDGVTNGDVYDASRPYVPCDPSAPHSACCNFGENCLGSGLCLSETGLVYRGGCTDKTWRDSACAKVCTKGLTVGNVNFGAPSGSEILRTCPDLKWVCGRGNDCANSSLTFDLDVGGIKVVHPSGNFTPQTTNPANPSGSICASAGAEVRVPSASATADCPGKNDNVLAVGAGVGIPLGAICLLAIAWGFWERKRRIKMTGPVSPNGPGAEYAAQKVQPIYEMPTPNSTSELAGSHAPRK